MDLLIILGLFLVAGAMLFGRPLKITITHVVPQTPQEKFDADEQQKLIEENKKAQAAIDSVVKTMQDLMGVNDDGDTNNPTA